MTLLGLWIMGFGLIVQGHSPWDAVLLSTLVMIGLVIGQEIGSSLMRRLKWDA